MADSIIDFGAPPVNEVVAGVRLEALQKLLIPHFGIFWSKIRQDFPSCEHAPPLPFDGRSLAFDGTTGVPLPRVWLTGGNEVVQLQSDALLFNWRQLQPGDQYPRFSFVEGRFSELLTMWAQFAETELGESIVFRSVELSYINVIPRGEAEAWNDTGSLARLFPDFAWRVEPRFLPDPESLAFSVVVPMANDDGKLSIRMNPGRRKADQAEVVRLELVARRPALESESIESVVNWLSVAREWIVKGFADITNNDVQRNIWKRG